MTIPSRRISVNDVMPLLSRQDLMQLIDKLSISEVENLEDALDTLYKKFAIPVRKQFSVATGNATPGQTVFNVPTYNRGLEIVIFNGSVLPTTAYTVPNGEKPNSITLHDPFVETDILEFIAQLANGVQDVNGIAEAVVASGPVADALNERPTGDEVAASLLELAQATQTDLAGKVDAAQLGVLVAAYLASLPTTLPAQAGKPWLNGGVLSIS